MANDIFDLDPYDISAAHKDVEATKPKEVAPKVKPVAPIKAKPVEELPQYRNNIAAAVYAAAVGATQAVELALAPPIGAADVGLTMAGQAAPLAPRVGADRGVVERAASVAPSAMVGRAAVGLVGGDPSKASPVAGWLGALFGGNPISAVKNIISGAAKEGIKGGVSAAAGSLGTQAAELTGAYAGTQGIGQVASGLLLPKDASGEEKEALGSILGAPSGAKFGGSVAAGIRNKGVSNYLADLKSQAATSGAKAQIDYMDSSAPVERTLDERKLARTLVRQGATPEEAIAVAKQSSAGVYGDVQKTEPYQMRVAEAAKQAVAPLVESLGESTRERTQAGIDVANRVVSTVTDIRNALKDDGKLVDPTLPEKAGQAEGQVRSGVQAIGDSLSNLSKVTDSQGFKDWVPDHVDLSNTAEADKRTLAGKYTIRAAVDNYYAQHVEPIRQELMDIPISFRKPHAFTNDKGGINKDKFLGGISKILVTEAEPYGTATAEGMVSGFAKQLAIRGDNVTLDNIYNFMNGVEDSNAIPEHAKGKIKDQIIGFLDKEMPEAKISDKFKAFKEAYKPYGSELKEKSPVYKMSEYDINSKVGAESALKHFDKDSPIEVSNTMQNLARENPDIAYPVVNALFSKLGEAQAAASSPEAGSKAMIKVLRDHLGRLDSLAQVIPQEHPLSKVLNSLSGVLETARDHVELAQQVKDTEADLHTHANIKTAIDKHHKSLEAYGDYALKSFDSLMDLASKDDGMFNSLKASPLGKPMPAAHDVAKEILVAEGGNPDLTKQRKLMQALSLANGTDTAVTDLIKYGIGQVIHKTTEDGITDKKTTLQALSENRDKIGNYVKNLDTLLRTTPGLSHADVQTSRAYLEHVKDALEVAGNDLVLKAINKAYGQLPVPKSEGIAESLGAKPINWFSSIASPKNKVLRTGLGIWNKLVHNKESIDAAILKRLDDKEYMKDVSNLKAEYLGMRESEVSKLLEAKRGETGTESNPMLRNGVQKVMSRVGNGMLAGTMGWLQAMYQYPGKIGSFYAERKLEEDQKQKEVQDRQEKQSQAEAPDPEYDSMVEDMRRRAGQ